MADENRIEGSLTKMGGDIKEAVGGVLGDSKLKTEGKADQVEGRAQNTVGGIKDAVRDVLDGDKR